MIIDELDYLEHYGVKGQKWGVRKQQATNATKAIGRASWTGAKAIGRGTKKTAIWAKDHPKTASAIVVGAAFVALKLKGNLRQAKMSRVPRSPVTNKGYKFVSTRVNKAVANSKFLTRSPKIKTAEGRRIADLIKNANKPSVKKVVEPSYITALEAFKAKT